MKAVVYLSWIALLLAESHGWRIVKNGEVIEEVEGIIKVTPMQTPEPMVTSMISAPTTSAQKTSPPMMEEFEQVCDPLLEVISTNPMIRTEDHEVEEGSTQSLPITEKPKSKNGPPRKPTPKAIPVTTPKPLYDDDNELIIPTSRTAPVTTTAKPNDSPIRKPTPKLIPVTPKSNNENSQPIKPTQKAVPVTTPKPIIYQNDLPPTEVPVTTPNPINHRYYPMMDEFEQVCEPLLEDISTNPMIRTEDHEVEEGSTQSLPITERPKSNDGPPTTPTPKVIPVTTTPKPVSDGDKKPTKPTQKAIPVTTPNPITHHYYPPQTQGPVRTPKRMIRRRHPPQTEDPITSP